jgi:hypothetical protein
MAEAAPPSATETKEFLFKVIVIGEPNVGNTLRLGPFFSRLNFSSPRQNEHDQALRGGRVLDEVRPQGALAACGA